MVFLVELIIVCLRDQNWESHLDLLIELCLNLMKVYNLDLLIMV